MSYKNGSPNCNKKSATPTKQKIRNPFDKALIEKLHKPICSPGMCKIYKKQERSFRWDINQASTLVPADIVACSSQFEPSPDPVLEKIAEEANEKFFSQEIVVPSPLEISKKIKPLLASSSGCSSSFNDTSVVTEKTVLVRDVLMKFGRGEAYVAGQHKGQKNPIFLSKPEKTLNWNNGNEVSAQTVLTLPPELPPEIEAILAPFCTYKQDQNISGEYEITANGSLRRQLFFEEHSDMEHDDSEQTDDEVHIEQRRPSSSESHVPVIFSPDPIRSFLTRDMKRTFATPLQTNVGKPCLHNKILDVVDFGERCLSPIEFRTPKRNQTSAASSSLASVSISPVNKFSSSDEEKNNFTSPELENMATCLDFDSPLDDKMKAACCKIASKKNIKRSSSLKNSPHESRRSSFSENRSQSMSSLNRSRSVLKLDFSMDMSLDGSIHNVSQADSEVFLKDEQQTWSVIEDTSNQKLVKTELKEHLHEIKSSTCVNNLLDKTPINRKCRTNVLSHEISKIRESATLSPLHMSLDNSLENFDIPLIMEKKIDFNNVDLNFLTDNASQSEYIANRTQAESSTNYKRIDSGFNDNTFFVNASSYYESAIKPSELTITNPKINNTALKEISNIHWMRVDSGFKDETSTDSISYSNDTSAKDVFLVSESKLPGKENIEGFERFMQTTSNKRAISMSFADDMTFNCKFSSTPSKNKSRNVHK